MSKIVYKDKIILDIFSDTITDASIYDKYGPDAKILRTDIDYNPQMLKADYYVDDSRELQYKPVVNIRTNKKSLLANGIDSAVVTIEISRTHEQFDTIDMLLDGELLTVDLENNMAQLEISVEEKGPYVITFASNPLFTGCQQTITGV